MNLFGVLAEVLFVGHSLVGPTLPGLVEAGLRQMEAPAVVEAQVINGAPLRWNWDNSASAEGVDGKQRIAGGQVSDLILTEATPIAAHVQWSDTAGLVALWADLARGANPEARVWLYETWPSLNTGTEAAAPDDPGRALAWDARVVADLPLWLQAAGDRAQVIPAGQAMLALSVAIEAGEVPGIEALAEVFSDDIHLNGKGLYFVAMVQLAALTGRSPEGLPAKLTRSWASRDAVITDEQAAAFQRVAWAAWAAFPAQVAALAVPEPKVEVEQAVAAPEVWAAPVAPVLEPVSNPNLALGLAGVNDWSVAQPFLDVMKTARPWIGHLPGQWGGWGEAELRAAGALGPEGWPVAVPGEVTGISTLILTDLPRDAGGVAGRYVLTYAGTGTLVVEGLAKDVQAAPGRVVFDYAPGEGAVIVTISAVDAADPIRDIRVVRLDREAALAAGQVFNPDWLARLQGVRGLRFMDWLATNDSGVATPADRPKVSDYTWARAGVPVEVVVDLANTLNAEPWITVPHLASDDLVREMAGVVAAGLDPGLKVWVEYSNELWNGQFAQARWAEAMAQDRWGTERAGVQFGALRAAEVMGLWTGVMPGDRVVRVVATQTGVKGIEEMILTPPLVLAEGLPPPVDSFDAYAVTGYVSGLLGADHKVDTVQEWLFESEAAAKAAAVDDAAFQAARYDLAVERAILEMRSGGVTGQPEDTLDQLLTDTFPYQAAAAARAGLRLVMYEGGTHVVGFGAQVENEALTAFFAHLNYTPQMGALYGDLLAGWARVTDAPFNGFVEAAAPGKWGSWGAMRHLWDENPRWLALARGCDPC